MKAVLADIQNGNFAKRFMEDQAAGAPEFKELRAKGEAHPIEQPAASCASCSPGTPLTTTTPKVPSLAKQ